MQLQIQLRTAQEFLLFPAVHRVSGHAVIRPGACFDLRETEIFSVGRHDIDLAHFAAEIALDHAVAVLFQEFAGQVFAFPAPLLFDFILFNIIHIFTVA